jgi:hypothetical protein
VKTPKPKVSPTFTEKVIVPLVGPFPLVTTAVKELFRTQPAPSKSSESVVV